ncbi:MAG: HNH endonuclease [Pyrinomonadaceae bacterium]
MSRYVSENLRTRVELRANGFCEYCRIAIEDTYFGGEIDHIISLKHRGQSEFSNLALACQPCNRNKGSDLGSLSESTKILVRFFNPRTDDWDEHFRINSDAEIEYLTEIGEVTAAIFGFNNLERIAERKGLVELGNYSV